MAYLKKNEDGPADLVPPALVHWIRLFAFMTPDLTKGVPAVMTNTRHPISLDAGASAGTIPVRGSRFLRADGADVHAAGAG
ncbi:MAG: hypothetical protein KF817_14945 [Phycisphaeraceae bacterium]|nr:hypothetical protein [Phycisphaeraceae bacterium]